MPGEAHAAIDWPRRWAQTHVISWWLRGARDVLVFRPVPRGRAGGSFSALRHAALIRPRPQRAAFNHTTSKRDLMQVPRAASRSNTHRRPGALFTSELVPEALTRFCKRRARRLRPRNAVTWPGAELCSRSAQTQDGRDVAKEARRGLGRMVA